LLRTILNHKQAQILKDERAVLECLQLVLSNCEVSTEDQKTLWHTLRQLDELFLMVVVGEFNSGKSAFINALIGDHIFPEGVTPTTDKITILRHSDVDTEQTTESAFISLRYPAEFLREMNIVDTPGTNAIIRQHEQLTKEFVPRSDLVIFVTSTDRPFTESERAFLEKIREWGKKIIIVLNKIDLVEDSEVTQIVDYIRQNTMALLGFAPEIFPVSVRLAMQVKQADCSMAREKHDRLWAASRFEALETYILHTLDEKNRIRLKLSSPLGIGERLATQNHNLVKERIKLLAEDFGVIENIKVQLELYRTDMQHDFRYRISDIEKVLLAMNNRGMLYFDDTLRFARIFDLLNTQRIQNEYKLKVVADTLSQIEQEVKGLIDWLVEHDLRQWQATLEYLENHLAKIHNKNGKVIGNVVGTFEFNHKALLDSVVCAAHEAIRSYDKDTEAQNLSKGFHDVVPSIAAVEVGAACLGVLLVAVLNTALLDFTGILAAGSLAVIGLLLLPAKKHRAKNELSTKLEFLKQRLMKTMGDEFDRELGLSLQRMREAIAPYTRFVHSEQQKLIHIDSKLTDINTQFVQIRLKIDEIN